MSRFDRALGLARSLATYHLIPRRQGTLRALYGRFVAPGDLVFDIGAQAAIWDQLRDARAAGLAMLLISADLEELIGLSDTIKVMLRGRLVADADPATVTPEQLGSAMTGAGSVA